LTRFVVDASVAVKWFLPEDHTEAARGLVESGSDLLSPDLVRAEVGNVMWKRWLRGEVLAESTIEALRDLELLPLRIESSELLMETAWNVARLYGRSFYDGLYVALAVQMGCAFVTADRKLYNALNDSDLNEHLVWVEDLDLATESQENA